MQELDIPTTTKSSIRTTFTESAKFIIKGSIASFMVGSFIGLTAGIFKNAPRPPLYALIYGSNWFMVGSSFLTVREGLLYYRHFVNDQKGVAHHLVRNVDGLVSSAGAGLVVGGVFGYHTSGSWAIVGGSVAYASMFALGQMAFNILRTWRQNVALERIKHPIQTERVNGKEGWWSNKYTEVNFNKEAFKKLVEFDPMVWGFNHARDFGKEYIFGEYPEWANMFVYAFDLEYKQKLRERIERIEAEIEVYKEAMA